MSAILAIKLGALGDLVQADGALRDIRENHPGDCLTVMTTAPYRRYMERCPWVDEVFVDPRASRFNPLQMIKLRRRLHLARFRRVYDLQQVGRTRFYYRRLFPATRWIGDVPGCWVYLKRDEERTCAAEHFAAHLHSAGLTVRHALKSNVTWMADDVTRILQTGGIKPGFVVLFPGASRSQEHKRWPHFRELALRLQGAGREVVTVPGPDEMELCRALPAKMLVPDEGYHDIFTLAGIIKQASFVIGNDTGPTHIAAHLGLPGLALFGGHMAPFSTGIQYTGFTIMESAGLFELPFAQVWQRVEKALEDKQR